MNRIEISDAFANMWRASREEHGKSQEYMAKALGVSKKTVQNWEAGTSCPNQIMGFMWFKILGASPLKYYLRLLYPTEFADAKTNSDEVTAEIVSVVKDLPTELQKKLLYILSGDHGSSVVAFTDLAVAHLQTPMRDRLNIAQCILTNYDLAKTTGNIKCMDGMQPNMTTIAKAIEQADKSVKDGKDAYSILCIAK